MKVRFLSIVLLSALVLTLNSLAIASELTDTGYELKVFTEKTAYQLSTAVTVKGNFREHGLVVPNVNIGLYVVKGSDIKFVDQVITDGQGEFRLTIPVGTLTEGKYMVKATANVTDAETTFAIISPPTGGGGGGGGGDSSTSEVEKPVQNAGDVPLDAVQFTDVPSTYWASTFIYNLNKKGIVSGYDDNTFRPDNIITRAEFTRLLTKAVGMDDLYSGEPTFKDVLPGEWYYSCIEAAVRAGFVSGYENNEFRPDEEITRQEIATILVRALSKDSVVISASAKTNFSDDWQIDFWARGTVISAVQDGLVRGYPDNTFRPRNSATRSESCAMIYKLIQLREN